jgi:hypothetical protein
VALVGGSEAVERQQILANMQVGIQPHLAADLTQRAENIARCEDHEADAAGLDHRMVDGDE